MNYKIISDSSSNLFTLEHVSFASVPLKILAGEKEYTDNMDLDVNRMIDEIWSYNGKTSTSCPNIQDWLDAFEGGDIIFAVSLTSNLSGCYAAAMQAKQIYESEHPGVQIHIVDSLTTGPELLLLIEKLQDLIVQEKSFEEICEAVEAYKAQTHLIFSLESLKNFAQNGRVSPAIAKLTGALGIRIIGRASDKGTLQPTGKARGAKKVPIALYKEMKEMGFSGGKVRVAHCLNESGANEVIRLIREEYPDTDILLQTCHGLCSYYVEKGGLLVGFES